MEKIAIMLTVFAVQAFCGQAVAQSANDAVKALKKVEAKIQIGTTLKDYSAALSDAKAEVNMFIESPEAKSNYKLKESIKKSLEHFEFACLVWERGKSNRDTSLDWWYWKNFRTNTPPEEKQDERLTIDAKQKTSFGQYCLLPGDQDILHKVSRDYFNGREFITGDGLPSIKLSDILPFIWKRAINDLQDATRLLFNQTNKPIEREFTPSKPSSKASKRN